MVLVLGIGASVAGAQTADPCYPDPTTQECINSKAAEANQSTGLPRTGSSNSIPTAAIAAGMVGVGTVLAVAARRRSTARRSLS
jgi:LPXTG-motif cell wall-anchored protein